MADDQEQRRGPSTADLANDALRTKRTIEAINKARKAKKIAGAAKWIFNIESLAPVLGIALLFAVTLLVIGFGFAGGGIPGVNAGDQAQVGQEGGDTTCVANSGTCQASCSQGFIADTSGATCTDDPSRPVCCLPLPSCGGTCVTGTTCANSGDTIDTGATNCNIGSVCCVPPSSQPPIKFYCQYNSNWNYQSCNINSYGCTPTSLAMILASYGTTYTPTTVSQSVLDPKYGQQIGCGGPNSKTGTSMDGARAAVSWAQSQGFTVAKSLANGTGPPNLSLFKKYTSSGYYLFVGAVMPFKHSSSTTAVNGIPDGHSVVVYDTDPNAGTVSYYDPTWCSGGRSNTPLPQIISANAITSWYYVYPIKK